LTRWAVARDGTGWLPLGRRLAGRVPRSRRVEDSTARPGRTRFSFVWRILGLSAVRAVRHITTSGLGLRLVEVAGRDRRSRSQLDNSNRAVRRQGAFRGNQFGIAIAQPVPNADGALGCLGVESRSDAAPSALA
jgi:hypothetical protein